MRYIGLALVMLAAIAFSREYTAYIKKRESECEAFLEFISHLRIQIGCYLKPIKEAVGSFSSEALEKVGFLDAVYNSERIYEGYESTKKRLSLSKEEMEPLEALFSSLGSGYLEEELRLINVCEKEMRGAVDKIKLESPKSIKLFSTLSVTAAVGFFILVI